MKFIGIAFSDFLYHTRNVFIDISGRDQTQHLSSESGGHRQLLHLRRVGKQSVGLQIGHHRNGPGQKVPDRPHFGSPRLHRL